MKSTLFILVGVAVGFVAGLGCFELANHKRLAELAAAIQSLDVAHKELRDKSDALWHLNAALAAANRKTERQSQKQQGLVEVSKLMRQLLELQGFSLPGDLPDDPTKALEIQLTAARDQIVARADSGQDAAATSTTNATDPRTTRRANVAGGDFRYEVKRWRYDGDALFIEGELENLGTTDWVTTVFQTAVYDSDDRMLGVVGDVSNNLAAGQTKAFTTYSSNVDHGENLRFQTSFEGGVEDSATSE
jgi:hypothetical protein